MTPLIRAIIDSSALKSNLRQIRAKAPGSHVMAVVKANAYGHGAPLVARAAVDAGADFLAVALVDEGIELRQHEITAPVLVLAEIPASTIPDAFAHGLAITIGSPAGARDAVAAAQHAGGLHRVHVKVDTGMHRMGVVPEEIDDVFDVLTSSSSIDVEGLYTHFSVAGGATDEERAFTRTQIDRFDDVIARLAARGALPRVVHAANTAGTLGHAAARYSMVRVGIALYGYLPAEWLASALEAHAEHLEPVLSLRARVVAVRRVSADARPSYGRRRLAERETTVVTVPFGYADGYPRRLFDAGAQVLINGRRYPLAGDVTMDQLVVDVGDDDVKVGDEVVLLGSQGKETISADEWALWAGTVSWEVLACLGARVPRVLTER